MKLLVSVTFLAAATIASAQVLTGFNYYLSDVNGNRLGAGVWNTVGGDVTWNIYVRQGSGFLNPGDGALTSPSINMSAPGTYFIETYQEAFANHNGTYYTASFYFDNSLVPQIAVVNRIGGGLSYTLPTVATLSGMSGFETVPNPVSATYGNITLTAHDSFSDVSLDRVSAYNNFANNNRDIYSAMVFTVVPEPASLAVIGIGVAAMLRRRRR
jgi:hypothetical protein